MFERICAPQVGARVGRKTGERVPTDDATRVEVVRPTGAQRNGSVLTRMDENEADVRMSAKVVQEAGMAFFDFLQEQATRLLHQVYEPEVS